MNICLKPVLGSHISEGVKSKIVAVESLTLPPTPKKFGSDLAPQKDSVKAAKVKNNLCKLKKSQHFFNGPSLVSDKCKDHVTFLFVFHNNKLDIYIQ